MKRRVFLAGLLALGLVVVAMALISDTGGRGKEPIKGSRWIGSAGVTRSVAQITARQRFVDRHPSVLPSADEIAAAEGVTLGEPDQGEAAKSEPQPGESGEQPQAGESGREPRSEEGGGPPGADQVGGQQVREKPEPGEESLPPKTAGPAPPLERSGRSAIGPRQALSSGVSFLGADFGDSGFGPP